jgi:hypothetical protein
MPVETTFNFRLTQKCLFSRTKSAEDFRYVIVKETKENRFSPAVRTPFDGEFTYVQKLALEMLSHRVNEERKKVGIL